MSHGDYMSDLPSAFKLVAHSDACPNVAIADEENGFYGVQFHPEYNSTVVNPNPLFVSFVKAAIDNK
jgi:GMP synthase (glutamine-hydrolysing)